jgi:hypothetical protein
MPAIGETLPAISEPQIFNSYTAPVVRPLNCAADQLIYMDAGNTIPPRRQFWFFTTANSIPKAPRKPYFWLAGSILPPWVPATLLQLLVGFPVPSGNSSGNPTWSLSRSFSFSATACLVPGKDSPEFSPTSKIANSTLTLKIKR